jgi:CelD/BcsL family acetyltransferase involved in cellulose biosynthesis/ribosomal protein S18 acetylase RimI-like enzyme
MAESEMQSNAVLSRVEQTDVRVTSTGPLRVEVVTDYDAFRKLAPEWNRLVEEAEVDFPFVRHEWILADWDCFNQGATLHIIVVHDRHRPVAIAPLMQDRVRMYGVPVQRLRSIANVYTERFDFILTVRSEECCAAIWAHLADHAHQWEVLELRHLPDASATLDMFPPGPHRTQCAVSRWPSAESPYVKVSETWDTYYRGLKKTHRHDMRRRIGILEQHGSLELEVILSDTCMDRDFADALRLESSAWKGAEGTAIQSRQDSTSFYRDVVRMAARNGWLRLYFLKVGGTRIAVRIALLFQNKLYMLKAGYDPQYASCAPGHVLSMRILEEAWRMKLDEVDFLGDAERWKLDWATGLHRHLWLFIFSDRLRSKLIFHLKVSLMPRIKAIRRALIRHGVRGCLALAARNAKQFVITTLYQHERHVWYVAAPAEIQAGRPLPDRFKLRRSRREHLDLLTQSNLYGWSAAESFLGEGGDLWLVRDNQRAVFCCWVFRKRMPTVAARGGWMNLPEKTVCLEGVMTDAAYRGRGIAPAAWSMIAQTLKGEKIRAIAIKVEESNRSMRRAVMKAGFHEMAITDFLQVAGVARVHVIPVGDLSEQDADVLIEVQKLAKH